MAGDQKRYKQEYPLNAAIINNMQNSKLHFNLNILNTNCIKTISSSEIYKKYQCFICQKIFSIKYLYENHLRSHKKKGENLYHCNICKRSFSIPARLSRHYRTHTGEKPFQCEYCSKSFSVKENLSVHRRIHTKERPYKCNICEAAFEHSGKLHRHMRIHTGERPHKCSLCNKAFIQSGQLVIHMRTHTGEKPYMCTTCEKGFTCSKQLKVHARTHTGEKPYKCEICNKSFGYSHVLKLHQVSHYGEKFYKCILCQETFNNRKLMNLHTETHSNSFHSHSEKSTESFIKNENRNKLVVYNKSRKTHENKMLIIAAVNDDKNPKCAIPAVATERNKVDCIGETASKMINDSTYLSISNCLNESSTPRYHFTNFDSPNYLVYKFKNNIISSDVLSNKNIEEKKEIDSKCNFNTQDRTGNLARDNNTRTYKINRLLSKDDLECLMPNIENNIDRPVRYNTVIRFANIDTLI